MSRWLFSVGHAINLSCSDEFILVVLFLNYAIDKVA